MRRKIRQKSVWRTGAVAAVILGLMASLAYALLQSQASVGSSTITTGSANLLISADGVHYGKSIPGFNFMNGLPGGYASPADGYPIYLENTGNSDLDMDLSITSTPGNPSSADLSKISFDLTPSKGETDPNSFTVQSLIDGQGHMIGDLTPGATREDELQVAMQADAAPGVTIGNIDLAFTGTARDSNAPSQSQ
jgi:hypothetical protein